MSDLISRQAAIDALIELSVQRDEWDSKEGFSQKRGIDAAICAIEDLPSARPERKTGRLIHESAYNWFRCNVCRKIYPSEFLQYFDSCQYQPRFNFCPNCGAKMEGEEE